MFHSNQPTYLNNKSVKLHQSRNDGTYNLPPLRPVLHLHSQDTRLLADSKEEWIALRKSIYSNSFRIAMRIFRRHNPNAPYALPSHVFAMIKEEAHFKTMRHFHLQLRSHPTSRSFLYLRASELQIVPSPSHILQNENQNLRAAINSDPMASAIVVTARQPIEPVSGSAHHTFAQCLSMFGSISMMPAALRRRFKDRDPDYDQNDAAIDFRESFD